MPEGTPTDAVLQYREQGYDDTTIQQGLQQQGFTQQQILDGFNQADQKAQLAPSQGIEGNAEAMVEEVVEEKWRELQKRLREVVEWKDKADASITMLDQQVKLLKENFDKLHEGVLGKISEYDSNLQDVGTSIKAMDQVFKKVLPTLTESVGKLDRISRKK
jgi:transcription termination factor NusB